MIATRYRYTKLDVVNRSFGPSQLREAVNYFSSLNPQPHFYLVFNCSVVRAGGYQLLPQIGFRYDELIGRTPREIWTECDRRVDLQRATTMRHSAIASHYPAHSKYYEIPDMSSEDRKRLAHFAALVYLNVSIGKYPPCISREVAAVMDAQVKPEYAEIAFFGAAEKHLDKFLTLK